MKMYLLMFLTILAFDSYADDIFEEQEGALPERLVNSKSPSIKSIQHAIDSNRLVIVVNKAAKGPTAQRLVMYEDGTPVMNIKISTGREKDEIAKSGRKYFSSTPLGFFRPTQMFEKYYSKTWKTTIPNPVFFNGGIALHGTTKDHFAALGTRDSGGCVRMLPADSVIVRNKIMSMGRGTQKNKDYKIIKVMEGKRKMIVGNTISVNKLSRYTGVELAQKVNSWDVVIVIYEDEGAELSAPSVTQN